MTPGTPRGGKDQVVLIRDMPGALPAGKTYQGTR